MVQAAIEQRTPDSYRHIYRCWQRWFQVHSLPATQAQIAALSGHSQPTVSRAQSWMEAKNLCEVSGANDYRRVVRVFRKPF
jgi:DNA-binding MarR family transcriptional regulator